MAKTKSTVRSRRASGKPASSRRSKATSSGTHLGLSTVELAGTIGRLNRALSNVSLLGTKTKKSHWDVVGPQFMSLHKLWDDQYETLARFQDEIAERIRTLGGFPVGTLAGFLREATLEEDPGDVPNATDAVAALLSDHEHIVRDLREAIDACDDDFNDKGSADFLTGLMEEHEKMAWMLRSFLQGEGVAPERKAERPRIAAYA
ncbi:MAG TPA: DNA starvation/stationary phase protection protein [Polyangiaceae bacterium]|nr:DNA starvation/stationary phase protection protein [Polyangiaceae bacterium]